MSGPLALTAEEMEWLWGINDVILLNAMNSEDSAIQLVCDVFCLEIKDMHVCIIL